MKLKYIFTSLVAALGLMAVSCTPETQYQLSEIQVSSSYIAIPAEGGNVEITLTAQDAWEFASVVETGNQIDLDANHGLYSHICSLQDFS